MSAMSTMEMPGGWTMSSMWMRMPGQMWPSATVSFVGMWVVMMVAMMLPSLIPTLLGYRESVVGRGAARAHAMTALVGLGYFAVWAAFGLLIFPLGVATAEVLMREPALSRAVPMVISAALLIAGLLQHTPWKARHLAVCREASGVHLTPRGTFAAWSYGVRLGLACSRSCAGLTAVALALGIMDLRVMGVVTTAITVERLAPNGLRVARALGAFGVVLGLFTMYVTLRIGASELVP